MAVILASLSGCSHRTPVATPYYNPDGDYDAIFRKLSPPAISVLGFDGKPVMDIRYVPSAPDFAPGPLQPALKAHSCSAGTRWIQVVTIDIPAPVQSGAGNLLFGRKRPWSFTDTSPDQRTKGVPFYSPNQDDVDFIDNPTYWGGDISKDRRSWVAHLFLVQVQGTSVRPLAGLEWGFGVDELGVLMPRPLRLLPVSTWESYRVEFAKEYSAWKFHQAQLEAR